MFKLTKTGSLEDIMKDGTHGSKSRLSLGGVGTIRAQTAGAVITSPRAKSAHSFGGNR